MQDTDKILVKNLVKTLVKNLVKTLVKNLVKTLDKILDGNFVRIFGNSGQECWVILVKKLG